MLGRLRKEVSSFSLVIGKAIAKTGISPNAFTLLAIPIAIIAAFFIALQDYALALLFVILAVLVDVIDGSIAKALKKESLFGNYLDAITDKVVECFFYIGFAFSFPLEAILALAFTMLNSYAKPRVGLVIITDNHDWPAIGERADRLLILIIGLAIAIFLPSILGFSTVSILLTLIALITLIGFVQRVAYAKLLIKSAEKKNLILPYLRKKKQ